ncbi:MAG: aspartate-semialdehyde dehydrogenase [Erysipelotrichaceae bacterium]|nr:aspartate-semialdehyde dehydrogenase [Erysipelotrichaceae bacterium]
MNIAIIGATGAVGNQMIKALEEENIEVSSLRLLASERSAGSKLCFKDEEITVEKLEHDSFKGMDIVLGAASATIAKDYAEDIVKAGAVFIDNSSYFRLFDDVPLVVPEINGQDARKHKGIISNPNCSTVISLMAVNGISRLSPIKALIASTYQAVSGAGKEGIDELKRQIDGHDLTAKVFPYQIAYNCIPAIGDEAYDLFTSEEMKLENEGRKIMHLPHMNVTCTCVRVPVLRSHSISLSVQCERELELDEVREAIASQEGVILYDDLSDRKYPMPLIASDQDKVYVGRIRKDRVLKGGIALFCAGDQIRKGAATNAVQIIKCL